MKLKIVFSLLFILSPFAKATTHQAPCQIEDPVQLYHYQDVVLALTKTSKTPEDLKEKMKTPLKCLVETYKTSEDVLMKYVAGSCLERLMGAREVEGFHKNASSQIIYNSLLNQQFESGSLLTKSEIAELASGKWGEYLNFCKGSVTQALCSDLLPTTDHIQGQNELLGATSMLVLKSAYHHFSGATKRKIARQITKLYKETSNESPLKRRVIDQIYREIHPPSIELRGT